jgi:predicted ferric reductase
MLLVARVPWIDKYYGHDKSTIAHKKLGKPILYLVIAHFAASLTQFAITDGKNLLDEFFSLISIFELLLATASLALMVLVVVTSLNIARRKLSYEAWFIVHLLSYIAVGVAVPHLFTMGSDIAGKPIPTIYWVTLYAFVTFNVVWYRVLVPVLRGLRHNLRVQAVVRESSDSVSIYLSGTQLDKLGGQAGQFYLFRPLTPKQWWRPHPFSISAAPNSNFVRFTIGARGDDTALLQSIKPGTRVMLEGPYGVFTEERRTRERVLLIASGIGIPPVRALAESMASRPGDLTVIYRVRNSEDAALLEEVREIARRRQINLHVVEGRRGSDDSWLNWDARNLPDQARLIEMAPWVSESDVYICGPLEWTKSVERAVKRAGTPEHQIHAEEYAW